MDRKKLRTTSGAIGGQKTKHILCPSKDTHATASSSASAKRRILQSFLLLWLDADINESNDDFYDCMTQLRRSISTIETFTDADQCTDYLTEIQDEKVLMIISGDLGQHVVPLIHDISQLTAVFVFCDNKTHHEQWAKQWPKVKSVFTEIGSVYESLKQTARQCDQDTMPISFVSTDEVSIENLDQLDQSFMYSQILKEILFEMDHDEQSIKDFTAYCRHHYADGDLQLDSIDKFEREYRDQSPIWWYTCEGFLYSMLNRALRTQEVDTIIKMGFFMNDLHRHIARLHAEQFGGHHLEPFIVYRGQGLSTGDFEKLTKTIGGLMSFNNFLSTSKDEAVSRMFAESSESCPEQVGILFKMTIDPSISKIPFADLNDVSYFKSEDEVLFSMHAVFRISDLRKLDNSNRLWEVALKLTNDDDPLLSSHTERMRNETQGSPGWDRLGQLLIRLGKFDKAEEVYEVLLDQNTSDDDERAHFYNHLGYIKEALGDYMKAISFYKKLLEIYQTTLPPHHPLLANSYNYIGEAYIHIGEYSKAFSFHEKALEIYQTLLPPNHPLLTISYNGIGTVLCNLGEYSKALSFYEKALEINQNTLPPYHPNLAGSYNNIGLAYDKMGEYSKALSSHEKVLEIYQKTLPPNHPDFAQSYNNIGLAYDNMKEYSKALSSLEKALEIRRETLRTNHPDVASSYNNIGVVYYKIGEYPKALSSHKKALDIRRETLPTNHPDLAFSYNNIGAVYYNIGEYSKALSSLEKALGILQHSLPLNHPNIQACRVSIEEVREML